MINPESARAAAFTHLAAELNRIHYQPTTPLRTTYLREPLSAGEPTGRVTLLSAQDATDIDITVASFDGVALLARWSRGYQFTEDPAVIIDAARRAATTEPAPPQP